MAIAFILQWLQIGKEIYDGGTAAWADVKAALQAKGYAQDTAEIDAAIVKAQDLRAKNQALSDS